MTAPKYPVLWEYSEKLHERVFRENAQGYEFQQTIDKNPFLRGTTEEIYAHLLPAYDELFIVVVEENAKMDAGGDLADSLLRIKPIFRREIVKWFIFKVILPVDEWKAFCNRPGMMDALHKLSSNGWVK